MVAVPPSALPQPKTNRPRRRLRRFAIWSAAVLGALVFCAPIIVAKTALRQRVLPLVFPDYPGKIETGAASLNWFAPVELRNVVIYGTDGKPLLSAAKVESQKTLFALLCDTVRLGEWRISEPVLSVSVRPEGSNLEDALAPMLAAEGGDAAEYRVTVVDGTANIMSVEGGAPLVLSKWSVEFTQPLTATAPLIAKTSAHVGTPDAPGSCGQFGIELSMQSSGGHATVQATDWHLDTLSVPLARWLGRTQLGGILVGNVDLQWKSPTDLALSGRVTATQFALGVPRWFGEDILRAEFLTAETSVELAAGRLFVEKLKLHSDAGQLAVSGGINTTATTLDEWTTALTASDLVLDADVNLARWAAMLPATLRLRDGLRFTDGHLTVRLAPDQREGARVWTGRVETTRLVAEADGQPIVWDKPVAVRVTARSTPTGPLLEELAWQSEFLTLRATGTPDDTTIEASCDLDRLTAELGRFLDLSDVDLAGQVQSRVTIRRLGENRWRAAAAMAAKQFRWVTPGRRAWQEDELTVTAGGDLLTNADGSRRIEGAQLEVVSGTDRLTARQTEAVAWPLANHAGKFRTELHGDLETWAARLQPFVDMSAWELAGRVDASATLEILPQRTSVTDLNADFTPLRIVGTGLHLDESRVRVTGNADWQPVAQLLTTSPLTWASPSLSLRADDVRVQFSADTAPTVAGRIVFRGGVPEMLSWFRGSQTASAVGVRGVATGQIQLVVAGPQTQADWHLVVDNPSIVRPEGSVIWRDERLECRGRGQYDSAIDRITFNECRMLMQPVTLQWTGTVAQPGGRRDLNLTGSLTCDMAELTALLKPIVGDGLIWAGRESREFAVRGPLTSATMASIVPKELTAHAAVGWQSVAMYGLAGGPSMLSADLSSGVLRVGPLRQPIGTDGQATVGVSLPLTEPLVAVVDPGSGITNLGLSPDLCRQWLKFVAPQLADSTTADGQLSVRVASAQVPLADANQMDVAGVLAVEQARVRPGPVAGQFVRLVQQVQSLVDRGAGPALDPDTTLVNLPKQNVEFRVENGRVTHRGLQIVVAGLTITSRGSVGFDESLSLVASIPIQDQWVQKNRWLAPLQGQSLEIPVGGTLSRPAVDGRILQDLARRLAESAITDKFREQIREKLPQPFRPEQSPEKLLEDQLNRGLNRLFDRR